MANRDAGRVNDVVIQIAQRLRAQGLDPDSCLEFAEQLVEQVRAELVEEVRESERPPVPVPKVEKEPLHYWGHYQDARYYLPSIIDRTFTSTGTDDITPYRKTSVNGWS